MVSARPLLFCKVFLQIGNGRHVTENNLVIHDEDRGLLRPYFSKISGCSS